MPLELDGCTRLTFTRTEFCPDGALLHAHLLSSTSFLLACLLVINHVKTELLLLKTGSQPGSAVYSGTMLGIGLSSCLSLALMGTVSVGEMQIPHVIFAIAFFLLLVIFQFLNVASRMRGNCSGAGNSSFSSSSSRWASINRFTELWMILWMVLTFVGFVMWQQTGHSVPQYLAVSSAMLHFFPYIWEIRDTEMRIHIRAESREEEEAARCLRDDAVVPMRHSQIRGSPLAIAGGVVAVIVSGLAFVLSKL